jgi:hypothetical protein
MCELTRFHTDSTVIPSCTYLPSQEAIRRRVSQVHADANPEAAR